MMLVGAGVGDAASTPAVTGVATSVTSTAAQLNGVIAPAGLDTFWAFQYGTSTSYGHDTSPLGPLTGTTSMSVSTLLRGLQPGTTYHFRLVAVQGAAGTSGQAQGFVGNDVTFNTPSSRSNSTNSNGSKHARASLRGRTLAVHHGVALIPWACSGSSGATCKGRISLTARGKIAGKLETVSCGAGTFSAATGKHRNVRAVLGSGCRTLLSSAAHHRLSTALKATFSQGTGNLRTNVTLVG
jgi:hypothetical protein